MFLLPCVILFAQDSTRVSSVVSDTVRVTASRMHDGGQLRSSRSITTQDVYEQDYRALRLLPSVHIVRPSGNAVSLRIRNAPAHHSRVTLLGLPLQSSLRGASNLAVIPMQDVTAVNRIDGLATGSARAIAGSVELGISQMPDSLSFSVGSAAGSYDSYGLLANIQGPVVADVQAKLSLGFHQDEGDFTHTDVATGGEVSRRGNDSRQHQMGLTVDAGNFSWYSAITNIDGSSPRSVVSQFGYVDNASLTQEAWLSVVRGTLPVADGVLLTSAGIYDEQQAFADPAASFGGVNGYSEEYHERRISLQTEYVLEIADRNLLNSSLLVGHERANSKGGSIDGNPQRMVALGQVQWSSEILSMILERLSTTLEIGVAANSHYRSEPFVGLSLQLPAGEATSLLFVAKRTSRWPSLNELYFLNFGNVNLRPEQSTQVDLSVQTYNNVIAFTGTAFVAHLKDMISAAPSGAASITAINFHEVRRFGAELEFAACKDNLSSQFTLSYIRSEIATPGSINEGNFTPYSPVLSGNGEIQYAWEGVFDATMSFSYTGSQFALAGNTEASTLEAYGLVDAGISRQVEIAEKQKAHIWVSLHNIFDTEYEHIVGYPMPGRTWRVGIQYLYE